MGYITWLEKYVGNLDDAFAYRTSRTLVIRDRRLGYTLLAMQAVIFAYVVLWQILFSQVYMTASDFSGVVRLQMQAPAPKYRWPRGAAPYCLNVSGVAPGYPLAADYAAAGGGSFTTRGGSEGTQRHCQFMDEVTAVPIPETDRVFLTSETRLTAQAVSPGDGTCQALESAACSFQPLYNRSNDAVTRRSFVTDMEFFTLLIGARARARPGTAAFSLRALFTAPPRTPGRRPQHGRAPRGHLPHRARDGGQHSVRHGRARGRVRRVRGLPQRLRPLRYQRGRQGV